MGTLISVLIIGLAGMAAIVGLIPPVLAIVEWVVRYLRKLWRGPVKTGEQRMDNGKRRTAQE